MHYACKLAKVNSSSLGREQHLGDQSEGNQEAFIFLSFYQLIKASKASSFSSIFSSSFIQYIYIYIYASLCLVYTRFVFLQLITF